MGKQEKNIDLDKKLDTNANVINWNEIKLIEITKRIFVFFVSISFLYYLTNSNSQLIFEKIMDFSNFVISNFESLESLKFFTEKEKLLLFFRFDHPLNPKPQFSYVSIEIFTHFVFPNIIYISLIIASYYKLISKKRIIIGLILINLFFYLKVLILAIENGLKITIFDKFGNIKEFQVPDNIFYKIISLLNNILNLYGSIGLRLLIVILIWLWVLNFYDKIRQNIK